MAHKEAIVSTSKTSGYSDDYTSNAREMISQTRRWVETMRGITFGPWQGAFSNSKMLGDATNPWFQVMTSAHDQWLDLWEAQANAVLDSASLLRD